MSGKWRPWSFQYIGVILVLSCGLFRPFIFFINPSYARALEQNTLVKLMSPLPLVFDLPSFFAIPTYTFHTNRGDFTLRGSGSLFSAIKWSALGIAHAHFSFEIRPGLSEQKIKLAQKLFCDPSLLPEKDVEIQAVTIERLFLKHSGYPQLMVKINCLQM
jgi:hypothetical protein